MQALHIPLIQLEMKWNKCFVVQYGNIHYTNIVVKMEKKSNFCLQKVAMAGRLRLRAPKQNSGRTLPPILPVISAHA